MNDKKPWSNRWRIAADYLNQPLFVKGKSVCFNPFKFKRDCTVQALERCWQIDYQTEIFRLQLEACWQAEKPT
ncbi:hypothetical protein VB780_11100 [Leptolyngbya sp. CCNP1308]|uniref:hypothetical protein n=1 Tax=Leptolyngbya sp. CCNP1308 TaxID=3110255 RepID=UPI002B210212|nr:hypothetical protein [Leptolyngbya sp. CCNP1308]MEA5449117.1 hypothetical protein [Leptolyngbya sp. CCNP1308]